MDLSNYERRRTGLLEFLVVLIIIFLGLIMALSYQHVPGHLIPALVILALSACLYVLAQERRLKRLQTKLVHELIAKNRQINRLGGELEEERHELKHERGKAAEVEGLLARITNLYRAISLVNEELEDEKVPGTALRAALELVKGNRGSIMLLDGSKRYLFIASAMGLPDKVVLGTKQQVGQGVAGWVAKSGEPILLNSDAQTDERFVSPTVLAGQVQSSMCIPLKLKNEVIGVMNLGCTEGEQEFTDSQMRLATIFGQHASVSVMNSRLMLSLKKKRAKSIDPEALCEGLGQACYTA